MPNSKGNPDFREKNQAELQKKYQALKTPFERYRFITQFAAAVNYTEMLPGSEEYIRRVAENLGKELLSLSSDERNRFIDELAEFNAGTHIRAVEELEAHKTAVDTYKENPQGDPPVYQMSEDVMALYQNSAINTLIGGQMNEDLTRLFRDVSMKTFAKYEEVWTNADMDQETKDKVIESKTRIIEPILMASLNKIERYTGVTEEEFQRQRMDLQKKSLDWLNPGNGSSADYLEDLEDKRKTLEGVIENLPGDAEAKAAMITSLDAYIKFFRDHPNIDLRTLEGNQAFFRSGVQENLKDAMFDYASGLPKEGITDVQQSGLMKLDDMARSILPLSYQDFTVAFRPTLPGYVNVGSPDYQVKEGKYGSFVRVYDAPSGNYFEEYRISESMTDPRAVTLTDGQQGLVYQNRAFDMNAHVQRVFDEIISRKPALAPYLKLKPEVMANVLNPALDEGRSLSVFQQFFSPESTIGPNKQYALAMFGSTAQDFFNPGPDGQTVDKVPEFAEEFQGLCEQLYAAAATQRMLYKAQLLDANGKSMTGGASHEAMGEIADLLGIGEMVAPTERVPVIVDGKPEFVTFAPKVEGKTILDPEKDNAFLNRDTNPLTQPEGLKKLADIQVLDFLCGTYNSGMDKNLVFQMDPENPDKIANIVRQNPGTAFGALDANNEAHFESDPGMITDMTRPSVLKVVNRSMADKVLAMTDDDLRKSLESKSFQRAQIDAAINRLHTLQEGLRNPSPEIREGTIHIMEDGEWQQKEPGELLRDLVMSDRTRQEYATATPERKAELEKNLYDPTATSNVNNIFRKALATTDQAKAFVKADRTLRGNVNPELRNVKGFKNRMEVTTVRSIGLKTMSGELSRNDPWYISGSNQFKEMKKAFADYTKKFMEYSKRWKENGGVRTREEMQTLSGLMEKVGRTADAYVRYKDQTGVKGRTGPGRYAYAKNLRSYAQAFQKQLDRNSLEVTTDRKMESIRQFYGAAGPDRDLVQTYMENNVIDSPADLEALPQMKLPGGGVNLDENDFASVAFAMAFNPEITGDVRMPAGTKPEELTKEENVIANSTLFTSDMGARAVGTKTKIILPRDRVVQYFPTIQKARQRASNGLREAGGGSSEDLAADLARGLEIYAKSELRGNQDPLGVETLTAAKMIHQAVSFLERNPQIMTHAKMSGLQDSTIQMIKAKYHTAQLYDRKEIATKKLADQEKHPLTSRQKAEYQRDLKMYQLLSDAVKKEVEQVTKSPEYIQRIQKAGDKVAMDMVGAAKLGKEARDKVEYIDNSKMNLALKEGVEMPKAMLSLASGLEKFQQQVERQMQQPQKVAPVVQGPSVSV